MRRIKVSLLRICVKNAHEMNDNKKIYINIKK